ncbi:hypothetical protein EDC04DRAFT_2603931 [Pisolithus marmoratus]|nr:hypothetical protein EDC04DRAFT_2603931 [Pisolithus marmoratus]
MTMGGGGPVDEQTVQDASRGQAEARCAGASSAREPGLAESSKVKGKAKAYDPVPISPCAQCVRARVECTFELAKCPGLKEQCVLSGGSKGMLRKKQALEETTSPRAGEKKKHAQVKSPEVEVQAGPLRSKSVTGVGDPGGMGVTYQHTKEMAKHQQIAKESQHMQRQFNNCLFDLLQEMEYQQVAERPVMEKLTRMWKVEEEERPGSDPEVFVCLFSVSVQEYHKVKTKSCTCCQYWDIDYLPENKGYIHMGTIPLLSTKPTRYSGGQHKGLEAPEKGDGEDMNNEQNLQVPRGY